MQIGLIGSQKKLAQRLRSETGCKAIVFNDIESIADTPLDVAILSAEALDNRTVGELKEQTGAKYLIVISNTYKHEEAQERITSGASAYLEAGDVDSVRWVIRAIYDQVRDHPDHPLRQRA